ncbi:MAG: hypothetical protein LBC85_04705, partial [Fibromonadaceae bacterium]|nr:hypothetical protein [Fibromonadaceae bacterium]
KWLSVIGWGIPAIIISSLVYIGISQGADKVADSITLWLLCTGVLAAIGTACALAHPFAILAALFLAPLTGLTPVVGVGMFTAFIQAYFCPPRVFEMETVIEDVWKPSRWWKNRFTRVILAFIMPGLFAAPGKFIFFAKIGQTISGG